MQARGNEELDFLDLKLKTTNGIISVECFQYQLTASHVLPSIWKAKKIKIVPR